MKRILVAEDDPDVSGLVKTLLEAAGHEVRVVEDGEKALDTFVKEGADVVILDVLLPGRNGFQVAEAIRAGEQGADVPIVMLSGVYRGPTYRSQARKRFGAVEYLEKPVEVDRLLGAVLQAMENPRPRYVNDGEPDDEPTELSNQGLPPLPVPPPATTSPSRRAAVPEPEPEPEDETYVERKAEPEPEDETYVERKAERAPAPAPDDEPEAVSEPAYEAEPLSEPAYEAEPEPEPERASSEPEQIDSSAVLEAEPFDPTATTDAWDGDSGAPPTDRDPDPEPQAVRIETGATTTDLPRGAPSPSEPPPDSLSAKTTPAPAVRSLAASARALSGADPEASAPSIKTPRVRAPRPSSGMSAFDPEQVGHTDRLLSALKSPAPEVTDARKDPGARPQDDREDAAFSLGDLPPRPDLRATAPPEPAAEQAPPPEEPAAVPYADPESLREKRLVERSIRVTRGAAQGDLRHTPFPVLLHRLFKERVSGALLLVKDPVKKIVYFKEGLPVFVKSNLLSECLGKVLVRERLISDAQCRESLRLLQETKRQQGSLLIQMGALSDANLTYGLQLQLRTKLYEVFSWTSGEYRLSTRTRPPMETAMLESTIEEILFEGIRSSFDPERLRRELEPCVDLYLALARDAEPRLQAMPMQVPDRQVVASINGTRSVREILARAPTGPGSAAQLVYALLCAELVETRTQPAAAASAPAPASPDTGPGTLTDGDGRTLSTAVEAALAPVPALLPPAEAPTTAPTTPLPVVPSPAALRLPGRDAPPPQSTAELLAEPDLPILPATDLDTLVENTLTAELHFQKAETHLASKRWDEAVRALQKANALCPDQPDFLASLGWALFCARGEAAADEALRELGRAIEASPEFDRAYLLRGLLWKAMGRLDDAVRDLERALACNPDSGEARRELEALGPLQRDELRR